MPQQLRGPTADTYMVLKKKTATLSFGLVSPKFVIRDDTDAIVFFARLNDVLGHLPSEHITGRKSGGGGEGRVATSIAAFVNKSQITILMKCYRRRRYRCLYYCNIENESIITEISQNLV